VKENSTPKYQVRESSRDTRNQREQSAQDRVDRSAKDKRVGKGGNSKSRGGDKTPTGKSSKSRSRSKRMSHNTEYASPQSFRVKSPSARESAALSLPFSISPSALFSPSALLLPNRMVTPPGRTSFLSVPDADEDDADNDKE